MIVSDIFMDGMTLTDIVAVCKLSLLRNVKLDLRFVRVLPPVT